MWSWEPHRKLISHHHYTNTTLFHCHYWNIYQTLKHTLSNVAFCILKNYMGGVLLLRCGEKHIENHIFIRYATLSRSINLRTCIRLNQTSSIVSSYWPKKSIEYNKCEYSQSCHHWRWHLWVKNFLLSCNEVVTKTKKYG